MKQQLLLISFAFWAVSTLVSTAQNPGCDGSRYIDNLFPTVKKTTVVYAPSINHLGQNVNLSVDVYEPQGDSLSKRPVVILAHGGSFVFGDKSNMQRWCELLAKKGYVAASIQYRLYPWFVLGFPDSIGVFDTAVKAVGDMKAAVRFFREDAATDNKFRADADNVFIGGYSAGAVTALHAGYLDENDQLPAFLQTLLNNNGGLEGISGTASNKTYPSHSKAIVNMSGGLYRSFWVDADQSPLISIHGTADATVPYTYGLAANIAYLEGSSLVHVEAAAEGVWNNLLTVPGAGHTDLYDQAQWQHYIDTFWINASTLLESLACATVNVVEQESQLEDWTIFPNPNAGSMFSILGLEAQDEVEMVIFDQTGKIVRRQQNLQSQQPISLQNLPKGMYWVQLLHHSKRFATQKLVIN